MATYSAISASEKDADSPVNVSLIDKLDQNPHAIAEGASGAPRIQAAAMDTDSVTQDAIAAGAVHQSELDTSTGTVSSGAANLTLPGGSYGFYPRLRADAEFDDWDLARMAGAFTNPGTSYRTNIYLDASSGHTMSAQQRYINSSPPFNLGDGDVPLFVFVELSATGDIYSIYEADVPPWAYNGPTDITPDRVYKDSNTGAMVKTKTVIDRLDLERGKVVKKTITVDDDLKNADMPLIPHPFADMAARPNHQALILNPTATLSLLELHDAGEDVVKLLRQDYIRLDNGQLDCMAPPGVTPARFRWRITGS